MIAENWQFAVAVVEQSSAKQARIGLKISPAQPQFESHFPDAGRAEEKFVRRIVNQFHSSNREPIWLGSSPQQQMRIEEQLHFPPENMCSISASPIRSKSSGTEICPAMNPSRLSSFPTGTSTAVTFTMGLPAFAITNGSPLEASSTSFDNCLLASWIFTVFMAN